MLPWPDQQLLLALCCLFDDQVCTPQCLRRFPDNELAAGWADIDDDGHSIVRRADSLGRVPSLVRNGALVMI